jgi:hypothetical protein
MLLSNLEYTIILIIYKLVDCHIKAYNKKNIESYNYEIKCALHTFWNNDNDNNVCQQMELKIRIECKNCKKLMSENVLNQVLILFYDIFMYTEKNYEYLKKKRYNISDMCKIYDPCVKEIDYEKIIIESKNENCYYKYFGKEDYNSYSDNNNINKLNHWDIMVIYEKHISKIEKNDYPEEHNNFILKRDILIEKSKMHDKIILDSWKLILEAQRYENLTNLEVTNYINKLYNIIYNILYTIHDI